MNRTDLTSIIDGAIEDMRNRAGDSVPADHITRQTWQDNVEALVSELRGRLNQPAFGLSEPEISISYHRPLSDFYTLVRRRAGLGTGGR